MIKFTESPALNIRVELWDAKGNNGAWNDRVSTASALICEHLEAGESITVWFTENL